MKGVVAYIAGPITDRLSTYKAEFEAAAQHLESLGAVVLNPAMLPVGLKNYEAYMRICLPMLAEADVICLLPGWKESKGALREQKRATECGMRQYQLHLGGDESAPFVRDMTLMHEGDPSWLSKA